MIVEPDFIDHWKTRMLCDLLQDDAAPLLVIRLWAHCQSRKTGTFENMEPTTMRAICRYKGDAGELWNGLVEAGFVRLDAESGLVVHQWEETNKGLVKNWINGSKGGRPRVNARANQGEPNGNPTVTQEEPNGNPTGTHQNPTVTDRVDRVDRVDRSPCSPPVGGSVSEAESHSGGDSEKRARGRDTTSKRVFVLKQALGVVESQMSAWEEKKKKRGQLDEAGSAALVTLRKKQVAIRAEMLRVTGWADEQAIERTGQ